MSTPASPRIPGKYGRRPADPSRPALPLARILTGRVPSAPVAADYLAGHPGWKMLGNDRAGCCNAVTWSNTRRLVTATLATEHYPSQDQVWMFYKTQNPGFSPDGSPDGNGPGSQDDQGMNVQEGLEYLQKHGGPDGVKAIAFAKVNVQDPAEVKAAIAIFGSVWTGISVLEINQDQFSEDKPWDYSAESPVEGGHAIITGGYGKPGSDALGGDERFITWAAETSFTDAFWKHEAEEAWVVIWPEHLGTRQFETGIDQAALAAAYQELTGRTLVLPKPKPAPAEPGKDAPSRDRQALGELASLVRTVAASADRDISEVVAWLHQNNL